MFGVLTVLEPEHVRFGEKVRLRLRRSAGLQLEKSVFRTALFTASGVTLLPGWREEIRAQHLRRGLEALKKSGCTQAVLPPGTEKIAAEAGIAPVLLRPALEACTGQITLEMCRACGLSPREACLFVSGDRIPAAAAMQLVSLAGTVRAVRVAGSGNDSLRAHLWRGYGIAESGVLPQNAPVLGLRFGSAPPPEGCLLTADLSGAEEAETGLWRPSLLPPEGALRCLPEGAPPGAFAAALLAQGALQAREIRVPPLDIEHLAQYNKETTDKC